MNRPSEKLREQQSRLAADVDEFLRRGGRINKIPIGVGQGTASGLPAEMVAHQTQARLKALSLRTSKRQE